MKLPHGITERIPTLRSGCCEFVVYSASLRRIGAAQECPEGALQRSPSDLRSDVAEAK